jgi:hypothetical protein
MKKTAKQVAAEHEVRAVRRRELDYKREQARIADRNRARQRGVNIDSAASRRRWG